MHYRPLFNYFAASGRHTVITDEYVETGTGTGIIHQAPSFGEDDLRCCIKRNIVTLETTPCPIDDNGAFTAAVPDWTGLFYKDAEKGILKALVDKKLVLHQTKQTHSVPHCWRSDTPLIHKAVPSWFVKVEKYTSQILQASKQARWVPSFVQDKRFHSWIASAHDWTVSRNRFWGTPIPVWASDDMEEIVCVGSVEELKTLSGIAATDLHRESIDHIQIPSTKGKGMLRRIEPVFDCWFESGSVPYAQVHYPFENKEKFDRRFPADFIAEGLDQTRGWFYTLTVLGTYLFGKCPFKNLIVNGLVLAEDGKKMSKRLKNYPDPDTIMSKHGADAMRIYLINSPAVRGEPLRFTETGVEAVVREFLLPWYNSVCFLEQCLSPGFVFDPTEKITCTNPSDIWLLSKTQSLVQFTIAEMEEYRLYTVIPRFVAFADLMTNWYIRFNRKRLKAAEKDLSRWVLFKTLYTYGIAAAPLVPFLSETLFQRLKCYVKFGEDVKDSSSVHFLAYPEPDCALISKETERGFQRMQHVVEEARMLRETNRLSLKMPLKELKVVCADKETQNDLLSLQNYINDEVNVRLLSIETGMNNLSFKTTARPNYKVLGPRLGKKLKEAEMLIKTLTTGQMDECLKTGKVSVGGYELSYTDIELQKELVFVSDTVKCALQKGFALFLDTAQDAAMVTDGCSRELFSLVQQLRKKAGLVPSQKISVYLHGEPPKTDSKELLEETIRKLEKDLGQMVLQETPAEETETAQRSILGTSLSLSVSKTPKEIK